MLSWFYKEVSYGLHIEDPIFESNSNEIKFVEQFINELYFHLS